MWFVFEAEYMTENGRANWNEPIRETMVWHGPFETGAEADGSCAPACGRKSRSTPCKGANGGPDGAGLTGRVASPEGPRDGSPPPFRALSAHAVDGHPLLPI